MTDRMEKFRGMAAKWDRPSLRKALVVGAYAALVLTACLARANGLDPASLWFDDVWTGALMKTPSVPEMLRLQTHIPSGFLVAVRLATHIVPDWELALQAVPFLLSLLTIPLMGRVVYTVTGNHGAALVAAALTALNPYLTEYSISTKPFSADFVVCCLVLLVGAEAVRRPSLATQGTLVIVGLAGFLFSYPSVMVSLAAVAVGWLVSVSTHRDRPRVFGTVTVLTLLFCVVLGAWFALHVSSQLGPAIRSYWEMGYMPVSSLAAGWDFLIRNGWSAVSGALPLRGSLLAVLAIPGLTWLLAGKPRRAVGVIVLVAVVGAMTASALRLYPVGGGRTDIYSFPMTIMLVACGFFALLALIPRHREVGAFLAAVTVVWACVFPPSAEYDTRVDAKRWVETLADEIRADDGLVIHPYASWLVACYGDWPLRFKAERRLAPGFLVEILRPNTFTVMAEHPREALVEYLGRHRFGRVFYLAERIHVRPEQFPVRVHGEIRTAFEEAGYATAGARKTRATELTLFTAAASENQTIPMTRE